MGEMVVSEDRRPRLTDVIGIGVLTRLLNRDLVDEVLDRTGRREQRVRLLPARVVVYYVMALTLFYGEAYEEVMRRLVAGLRFTGSWRGDWKVPTTGAIAQARARLGEEPLRELHHRVAVPMAGPGSSLAWYQQWRVMAVDGVVLDVPDTPENAEEFGRSFNGRAVSPFPQVRVVGLAECGSRAVVGASIGPLGTYERNLMLDLLPLLDEEMLLLADRGFFGYEHWRRTRRTGAHLLWRIKQNADLPILERFADGSYRSVLLPASFKRTLNKHLAAGTNYDPPADKTVQVRVIEFTVGEAEEPVRLVTSLLDWQQTPAIELAALYRQRWEFELALDEIQTHQLGRPRVLRSKSPAMVRQEIWALLLTHYAIRQLMWEAGDDIEIDPDRISFMRTIRLVRREVADQAALSPLPAEPTPAPRPERDS